MILGLAAHTQKKPKQNYHHQKLKQKTKPKNPTTNKLKYLSSLVVFYQRMIWVVFMVNIVRQALAINFV